MKAATEPAHDGSSPTERGVFPTTVGTTTCDLLIRFRRSDKWGRFRSLITERILLSSSCLRNRCKTESFAVITIAVACLFCVGLGRATGFIAPFFVPGLLDANGNPEEKVRRKKKQRKQDYELDFPKNSKGQRKLVYVRVSSSKQVKNMSPGQQEKEGLKSAKSTGAGHVYVVFDYATGTNLRRKLVRIDALQREGKLDEIIVRHVDRLGRECFDLGSFLLGFLSRGGTIRTPDRVYKKDPESFMLLCTQLFSAQISNTAKAEASKASKTASFLKKHWNKAHYPIGYMKDRRWIKKKKSEERLVLRIVGLFLTLGDQPDLGKERVDSIADITRIVNNEFNLTLKPDRITHLLNDPILRGDPSHLGARLPKVQNDLRYIRKDDEEAFQSKLDAIALRYERKAETLFQEKIVNDVSTLKQLCTAMRTHTLKCPGELGPNGTNKTAQVIFVCNGCGDQFLFPSRKPTSIADCDDRHRPESKQKKSKAPGKDGRQTSLDDLFNCRQ